MDDLEKDCLKKLDFTPTFFYRYVDDIITCVPTEKINETIDIFNTYDNRLQFTFETEINNSINFLDLKLIKQDNGTIIFDWYMKPTFSGRFLNYNSQHPPCQKIAMVYNLIDRAVKLTDKKFHDKNIKIAEEYLTMNNYPTNFIKKYTQKRLKHIHKNPELPTEKQLQNKRKKNYIPLPYLNNLYENISSSLKNFYIDTIPTIQKNLKHIIIKAKDKTAPFKTNNVVYKINCENCTASYVGQTKRTLEKRLDEHSKKRDNVIHDHETTHNHNFDYRRPKILDKEKNYNKRIISEMIHINLQKNPINKKEDTQNLSHCYTHLFKKTKLKS